MINTIQGIVEAAKGGQSGVIAVAAAHDEPVIEAVVAARREGIATPILVGHTDEICRMLQNIGKDPASMRSSPPIPTRTAPPRLWLCAPRARPTSS